MYGYAAQECRSEIIENTPRINSPLEVLELLEPFGVAC
jgi:hypothetical protein